MCIYMYIYMTNDNSFDKAMNVDLMPKRLFYSHEDLILTLAEHSDFMYPSMWYILAETRF